MPPRLYLVRHADAAEAANDAARPLSARGRRQVAQLARVLRRSGAFAPRELWHSPRRRARETAEQLRQELELDATTTAQRALEPEADPAKIARRLRRMTRPLALVGHEPHLGRLASLLVAGAAQPVVFTLEKAAILALEPAGDRWSVRWQLSPEVTG